MTDPEIAAIVFREVIGREGSPQERSQAIGCYLKHLPDAVAESDGYRVMPGIEELLPRLIDDGVLLGLVTGNIEAAAHIKLARGTPQPLLQLRRLRLRLCRPHRGDRSGPAPRRARLRWHPAGRRLHLDRRHPARRQRPATAPGSE